MNNKKFEFGIDSIQWFVFLLANSLTVPIVIGQVFHLSSTDISGLMQRTFFIVGVSSMLSGFLGHRLPIPDGPAGLWLGVFVLMGQIAVIQGTAQTGTLQLLGGTMLLTGVFLVIIGALGWMNKLLKLFTPLVNGVFLTILGIQLSSTFLKGMIGVSDTVSKTNAVNIIISFSIFIFVLFLSIWGKGWLKSYAILIGMVVGTTIFVMVNGAQSLPKSAAIISFPKIFYWGLPKLNSGMIASSILITFMIISGIVTSVSAMQQVIADKFTEDTSRNQTESKDSLKRAGILGGIATILSSIFSVVGVVPFAVTAGFVRMTGKKSMGPFFIGSIAFSIISFFPGIYSLLAILPGPVAYASMLPSLTQMVGIGISSVLKEPLDQRRLTILSLSLSLGAGVMFLPQKFFAALPTVLQYVLSNGVMVGMLIALVFEQTWHEKKSETDDKESREKNLV